MPSYATVINKSLIFREIKVIFLEGLLNNAKSIILDPWW